MIIFYYVKIIWRVIFTPDFLYNIYNHEKYYKGESVNIHIQLLINIIQENNRVITTKKGKGKLPLFCGNIQLLILVHGANYRQGDIHPWQ